MWRHARVSVTLIIAWHRPVHIHGARDVSASHLVAAGDLAYVECHILDEDPPALSRTIAAFPMSVPSAVRMRWMLPMMRQFQDAGASAGVVVLAQDEPSAPTSTSASNRGASGIEGAAPQFSYRLPIIPRRNPASQSTSVDSTRAAINNPAPSECAIESPAPAMPATDSANRISLLSKA